MHTAIIFDFFDVIRTDAYRSWLSKHNLKNEGEFLEANRKMDKGFITVDDFLKTLSELTGIDKAVIDAEMEANVAVDYQVLSLIEQLREQYTIGLLSNAPASFLRPLLQEHDLEKYFDTIIISSEVGLIKPHPDIFYHTLMQLPALPEETIFIDDNPANIAGAQAVGITGIVYKNINQLRTELQHSGIHLD